MSTPPISILDKLSVRVSANGQTTDVISIKPRGTGTAAVTSNATQVLVGGVVVGTYSGGRNNLPFVIAFNSAATPARVQNLLRAIAFSTSSENPSTLARTIQVTLNDGDGGASTPVSKTVNVTAVNDLPVVAGFDPAVNYTRGASPVILDTDATVSDADATNFNGRAVVGVCISQSAVDGYDFNCGGWRRRRAGYSQRTDCFGWRRCYWNVCWRNGWYRTRRHLQRFGYSSPRSVTVASRCIQQHDQPIYAA